MISFPKGSTVDEVLFNSSETLQLLEQAREGDASACGTLLSRHRAYLEHFIALRLDTRLRVRVDASDIVQEAQLEATRRFPAYLERPSMPFRLWLRQLAMDRLLMAQRRHLRAARRSVGQERTMPDASSVVLARQLLARGPSPSENVRKEELARRVRQAVIQLPDPDREILLLRTFEGLAFEEVAFLLNVDCATARKRHGRALLRLHRLLTAGGVTEAEP